MTTSGERARRRATHVAYAIEDADLLRPMNAAIAEMMAIPEADRAAFFRGWERMTHSGPVPGEVYSRKSLAGSLIRLARICWQHWPPQEETET